MNSRHKCFVCNRDENFVIKKIEIVGSPEFDGIYKLWVSIKNQTPLLTNGKPEYVKYDKKNSDNDTRIYYFDRYTWLIVNNKKRFITQMVDCPLGEWNEKRNLRGNLIDHTYKCVDIIMPFLIKEYDPVIVKPAKKIN